MPFHIQPVTSDKQLYMELLLIADPSEQEVLSYLHSGELYVMKRGNESLCAAVMLQRDNFVELMNLVTHPSHLRMGYATEMMNYLLDRYKDHEKICLGTGGTGIEGVDFFQVHFYRKLGFRVAHVVRNYFIDNYPDPIYEDNGLQCVDRVWMEFVPEK